MRKKCSDCGRTFDLEDFPVKNNGSGQYRAKKCENCFPKWGRVTLKVNRGVPRRPTEPVERTYMEGRAFVKVLPAGFAG